MTAVALRCTSVYLLAHAVAMAQRAATDTTLLLLTYAPRHTHHTRVYTYAMTHILCMVQAEEVQFGPSLCGRLVVCAAAHRCTHTMQARITARSRRHTHTMVSLVVLGVVCLAMVHVGAA